MEVEESSTQSQVFFQANVNHSSETQVMLVHCFVECERGLAHRPILYSKESSQLGREFVGTSDDSVTDCTRLPSMSLLTAAEGFAMVEWRSMDVIEC